MRYRFLGEWREQLWFINPNFCGAFIAVTTCLAIALFFYLLSSKRPRYLRLVSIPVALLIIFLQVILAQTYSRGGYVALTAGIVVFAFLTKKWRSLIFLPIFFVVLLFTAKGVARVGTIADISEGSIFNRLLLWRGGACVIADHWWSGVGSSFEAGILYTRWYQPLWLNTAYGTLLNDLLNIAAAWGVPCTLGLLLLFAYIFRGGWRICRSRESTLFAGALAGLTSYIVASFFTTMYHSPTMNITLAVLWFTILFYIAGATIFKKVQWSLRDLLIPAAGVLAFGIVGTIACFAVRATFPYTYKLDNGICTATPRGESSGTVIICVGNKDFMTPAVRTIARPLMENGYTICLFIADNEHTGLREAEEKIALITSDRAGQPYYIFADGLGGKQAFIAGVKAQELIKGMVLRNIPLEGQTNELAPTTYFADITTGVLVLNDTSHRKYLGSEADEIIEQLERHSRPYTVETISSPEEMVTAVSKFLRQSE